MEKKLSSAIFAKILYKTNFSSKKVNQVLLSTDLLKSHVKKELLAIAVCQLEYLYNRLLDKNSSNAFYIMQTKSNTLFLFLIKGVCEEFLTKQYGVEVNVSLSELRQSLYTKTLLLDKEILFQVPYYALAEPNSPIFRLIFYPIYNSASASFIEALLDNLILEISNCVVYFILLNFSSIYNFRQTLYKSKFLSLRNFERFKNNLNWQTRIKMYVKRPLNLYNSRYDVLVLRTSGLYCRTIYANRVKDIANLKKVPLLTIVVIEVRDFLTSRLDETLYTVVTGLRFTLTSVLGQVIGLIWRGIIEGLKK
jgi:hypothetical protein